MYKVDHMSTPNKNPYVSKFGHVDLGRRGAKRTAKGKPDIKLSFSKLTKPEARPKAVFDKAPIERLSPTEFKAAHKLEKEIFKRLCEKLEEILPLNRLEIVQQKSIVGKISKSAWRIARNMTLRGETELNESEVQHAIFIAVKGMGPSVRSLMLKTTDNFARELDICLSKYANRRPDPRDHRLW